jgi:hypothetical protein
MGTRGLTSLDIGQHLELSGKIFFKYCVGFCEYTIKLSVVSQITNKLGESRKQRQNLLKCKLQLVTS